MKNLKKQRNKRGMILFFVALLLLLLTEGGRVGFLEFLNFLIFMFLFGLAIFVIAAITILIREKFKKNNKEKKL